MRIAVDAATLPKYSFKAVQVLHHGGAVKASMMNSP